MKKISILSLHLGYGGIEKSIVALANMLVEKYKVEIACTYKLYDKPIFELDKRVEVKYLMSELPNKEEFKDALKKYRFFKAIKEGLKSVKILSKRKSTMINYIKNCHSNVIISTRDIFNNWLCEYAPSKVLKIGWEHNHYHNDYKYARDVIRSAKRLDYFVLVSQELKAFYMEKLKGTKCYCTYIPNVIDEIPVKSSSLTEERLISVGRLSEEKGYHDLLKIFYLLSKEHKNWHLDIIGDGIQKPKLERYIKTHKLEDNVTLHGFQPKEYINKMFNKSSLYIMTSHTESFGIVLIEAMAYGIPCIAFDSAEGAREIINSGMNGFLIKHRNYSAMIKKIEDLMADKEKRLALGKAAKESVKKYASCNVKEQWFELIEEK